MEMADAALGVVMETVLNAVVSLAAEEITLAWGVHEELKKLAQKRNTIQALLSDAQSKQLTSQPVQDWLDRLGSVAFDAQIVLDEFGYEILRQKVECRKRDKVRTFFSSSNPVVHRAKIARKIKDVMSSIEGVFAESNQIGLQEVINSPPPHLKENRSTDPFVDDSEIVGRDDDTSTVIDMLVGSDYQSKLPVIAILGTGGAGKTTLAQLVYQDDRVQSYFDIRVWVCVSDDFNTERLLAEILQSLTATNRGLTNVEALVGKLKEQLSGKRYLLVLDDVWNENGGKWDRMRRCLLEIGGSKGSSVLITTRSDGVAKTMRTSKHHRLLLENQIGLREVINSPSPYLKENRSTVPFVDDSEIVGRDDDTSKVINMLVGSDYQSKLPVIAILGMGGVGKTTLAQLVYQDDTVQSYFDIRVWVCVSDDFNTERLLAEMLQSLTQTNHQLTNVEALVGKLKEQLSGKRYLLVLDDVWNENGGKWDRMRRCLLEFGGSKGSSVLITTRSDGVAKTMQTSMHHRLQRLSDEQSWKLFEKWAFADGGAKKSPALVEIGERILKRCGGVPLAIRVVGGLLYKENCESEWSRIERSELWNDSDERKRVLSDIKLSYDHLPSLALKQCFAYCAIFQKDERIEKDKLIQLWMAQGLLNPPKESGEDKGSEYFDNLLRSSLLEDAGKDGYNNFTYCRMRDLEHDFSLQVSKNYCFHLKDFEGVKDGIKAVHLSIIATEEGLSKSLKDIVPSKLRTKGLSKSLKDIVPCLKDIVPSKLRTLHLEGCYGLEDLFANFKYVTILILKDGEIEELPNSIGKMEHLRFLDISSCRKISRLPKSVAELYYLQTLRVYRLDEVPKGFQKLTNLTHFYVGWIYEAFAPDCLIPGLSQLKNLQTLPFFKVDKRNGCQIEELEHLGNLKGELKIYCLQNVSDYESALKSKLSEKSKVQTLYLHWDWPRGGDCDDSEVMEGLQPHPDLKSLTIDGYQSPKFPLWMTAGNDLKLLGLVKLTLKNLNKCEQLPSLGILPCLEQLELRSLTNVRCIGEEFYGQSKESNLSNGSQITLFPLLKVFKLRRMWNLEKWSDEIVSSVKVFPVLEEMQIDRLPKLCSFPNLGCLPKFRRLRIMDCPSLTLPSNWNEFGRLEKSEIEDERAGLALTHDSSGVVSSWEVPSSSYSSSCPSNVHSLPSLHELVISNCDKFATPFCSQKILAPLKRLVIWCNPSLWPKDLHHLINLRSLELAGNLLEYEEADCFPFPYSISNVPEDVQYFPPSLMALTLRGDGLRNVTSLSDQIQYLTSLRDLTIGDFDRLEALPEWLGNITSLQNLTVLNCKKLKQLPSAEAFRRLTNLQCLHICGSSNLEVAFTQGSGSEWAKIGPLIPKLEVRFSSDN